MRYLPTIDLWNPALNAAVRSGQLKLQSGQWVKCGSEKLSRFVKASSTSIWAVHWQGSGKATLRQYLSLNESVKMKRSKVKN